MRYQCDWTYPKSPRCTITVEVPFVEDHTLSRRLFLFHYGKLLRDEGWTIDGGKAYCRIHRDGLLLRENRGEIRPEPLPKLAHAVTNHGTYVRVHLRNASALLVRLSELVSEIQSTRNSSTRLNLARAIRQESEKLHALAQESRKTQHPKPPQYGQGMVRPFLSSEQLAQRVIHAATITDRVE